MTTFDDWQQKANVIDASADALFTAQNRKRDAKAARLKADLEAAAAVLTELVKRGRLPR